MERSGSPARAEGAPGEPAIRIALLAERAGELMQRTRRGLARLGPDVRVDEDVDPAVLLRRMRAGDVDLVVLDGALRDAAQRLLAARRVGDPPALVVARDADEAGALAWFRRGAADCVALTAAYEELLPMAALEQIQRHRAAAERGAAEQRIRWLERLHEAIVEELPAGVAVVDPRGRVVTSNPELARLFGVAPREAAGRPLQAVLPPSLLAGGAVAAAIERAARGGSPAPRVARMDAEGAPRAFDVRAQRLDEDGRVLLVLSEVTRTEELTRQVDDLRRYTENIIQNMNSALVVVEIDGTVSFANPAAERILGAPAGALPGASLWDWFEGPLREGLVERTLREGVRFRGAEGTILRGGRERVPIGTSCAPLVDGDGSRRGAIVIFQDLTEIKQLQRQVLQSEKMASIGQLAAGVAHEINNPMGFIHANLFQLGEYVQDLRRVWDEVQALRKAGEGGDVEEQHRVGERLEAVADEVDAAYLLEDCAKAVRESLEGSERIRHIVQDLRAFSHPDGSDRTLADVNECLDSTANIVWTMMKHAAVLTRAYEDVPPIRCWPMQLKQVFMNLLVNAYQAIQEAGAERGRPGEIRLRTRAVPYGVLIEVSDDGVGIAPEAVDRVFEPFFTTKEVGVGTGLGLSIAYNIVKRHGGTLHVESELGVGTTFRIVLPRDGGEAGGSEPLP
ncbi:MAG TPA: PAS domain-containing protein [Myxococcota bacterium]|nr:PAS domain-containing protein [Myxococcota bacterium]